MQTPEEFARGYVARFCPAPEPCQPCLDDSGDLADLIRARDAEVRASGGELVECNCGYGGFHDDVNPRCAKNQAEKVKA